MYQQPSKPKQLQKHVKLPSVKYLKKMMNEPSGKELEDIRQIPDSNIKRGSTFLTGMDVSNYKMFASYRHFDKDGESKAEGEVDRDSKR